MCNFRVSVDGDWLCLKELADVHLEMHEAPMDQGPDDDSDGMLNGCRRFYWHDANKYINK